MCCLCWYRKTLILSGIVHVYSSLLVLASRCTQQIFLSCNYLLQIVSQWQMDSCNLFPMQEWEILYFNAKNMSIFVDKLCIFGLLFFVLSSCLGCINSNCCWVSLWNKCHLKFAGQNLCTVKPLFKTYCDVKSRTRWNRCVSDLYQIVEGTNSSKREM